MQKIYTKIGKNCKNICVIIKLFANTCILITKRYKEVKRYYNYFVIQRFSQHKIALKYLLSQHDIEIISQLILLYVVLQKTHEALGESNLKDSILQEMPPYSKEQLYAITKDLNEIIINKECYKLSQLSINGNALQNIAKSMGTSLQGKQIGILLTKLLYAVIEEEIPNTFHSLESRARFYIARL